MTKLRNEVRHNFEMYVNNPPTDEEMSNPTAFKMLAIAMVRSGIPRIKTEMAEAAQVSVGTIERWADGTVQPYPIMARASARAWVLLMRKYLKADQAQR